MKGNADCHLPNDKYRANYDEVYNKRDLQIPWHVFARNCPWAQERDNEICCNGYAPCDEEGCAVYHFVKILQAHQWENFTK